MIFSCISLLVGFILLVLDKGPPVPPFGDDFHSIDCHGAAFESYTNRGGFLDVVFSVQPPVEYPPSYLAQFLSISINTPPTTMEYSSGHIKNISRNASHFRGTVAHSWAGPSTITARCLDEVFPPAAVNLSNIVNYDPHYSSRSEYAGDDHARFRNVCLEFEKFLYFVEHFGDRPAVPFDDDALRFEMLPRTLEFYLKEKKVQVLPRTFFLVAPFAPLTWQMILLTMIPLAISVDRNLVNESEPPYFIFRKRAPDDAASALRFFSTEPPRKLLDIMCFDRLIVTPTYRTMRNRLASSLDLDIAPLRRRLPRILRVNGRKVVVADNLWDLLERPIKGRFRAAELVRLPANLGIDRASQMLMGASILVGDHITSLIHMIWMAAGKGNVIDVSPKEFACNPWARNMADKANLSYVRVFDGEKCRCATFGCYQQDKPMPPATHIVAKVLNEIEKVSPRNLSAQ
jgi:hypothetical protein